MDWRDEYSGLWPVLDDGRLIIAKETYENAQKSTYDPKILKFMQDGIRSGRMVVDNGSIKFNVLGKKVTLSELIQNESPDINASNPKLKQAMADEYFRLRQNEDVRWINDEYNFEALKAAAYAMYHIRYNQAGVFDPGAPSKYEMLKAFYGYGIEKDEKPLRDSASVWTTSLNVGVNCAQKEMKIRFWENDDVVVKVKYQD
ncbi:MAG: hypothetical protein J5934_07595 [Succinivibrio sp.]|nr:hypothetical protein [Succinivibrio sp.]